MSLDQMCILSIDGDGIRSLIPALILEAIEARTGKPIAERFQAISGTCTGGILSLGLTMPGDSPDKPSYSAKELAALYGQHGERVFKKKRKLGLLNALGRLFDKIYPHAGIALVPGEYFGDVRLSACIGNVVITSYELASARTFIFKSRLARKSPDLEDFYVRDVARSTAAAPTYFETHPVGLSKSRLGLIYSGVFVNNPPALAFTEAKEVHRKRAWMIPAETSALVDDSNGRLVNCNFAGDAVAASHISEPFYMLSLGTGSSHRPFPYDEVRKRGMVKWICPIMHIMMQSNSESVHYQMRQLLLPRLDGERRYDRLNIENMKPEHVAMDDASPKNIAALRK